jgi:hypothetical protein
MDWVKPKHRARQLTTSESSNSEVSASTWLKQLCDENIAVLQASIPVQQARTKFVRRGVTFDQYLRATLWGTGVWEVENPSHREYLTDLVDAFGKPLGTSSAARKRGNDKSRPAEDAAGMAQEVASANQVGKWIAQQLPRASYNPYVALCCAGWFHALPTVGRGLSPSLWIDVLQCALTQVDRAWESGPTDGLFPWMIWACEMPLALAKQLSHLGGKDRIVSETLNRIALILEESTDDSKGFLARGGQDLQALMACIIRCRWSADTLGARKWYPPQRKAIGKLATATLALADADGRPLFFDPADSFPSDEFWIALNDVAGNNRKLQLASACALPDAVGKALGEKPSKLRKQKTLEVSLPKHSHYWEKNSIACMRRSWQDRGSRVAVDFSSDVIWLDVIGQDGQRVLSGDWDMQVLRNQQPLEIDVSWQEVCWFTDDDVDYLELECEVEDVCKIQRQIMLVREEGLVYFADALISEQQETWSLKSTWTCPELVQFRPETKSNEGKLVRDEQTVALALPVGIPEWRRVPSHGQLTSREGLLELSCQANSKRIYAPLVLSLRGVTKSPAYTWRQLTIAEELQIQPRDVAEAYRVQIHHDQWVFYRSLTPCTRRTVMGLHLNTEFYAGRFSRSDGEYEAIVEVNPA